MTGFYWSLLIIVPVFWLAGWLLAAPLVLVIDSDKQLFLLQWRGLVSVRLVSGIRIRLWVVGWTREIDPWKQPTKSESAKPKKKPPVGTTRRQMPARVMVRKVKAVLQTFHVQTCDVNLDTDDYLMNAYLYPLFGLLSGPGRRLRINFNGEMALKIIIENRLYRILFAFINS